MITPREQSQLLCAIARRAANSGITFNHQTLVMDLYSLDNLDLKALLEQCQMDFVHDIAGIQRHMDRSNWPGKLTHHFSPRCGYINEEVVA